MIPVSYEKSCAQVYTEATAAEISSHGTLDILAFVFVDGADGRWPSSLDCSCRLAELPSWALDFTCIDDDSHFRPASSLDLVGNGVYIDITVEGLISAVTIDEFSTPVPRVLPGNIHYRPVKTENPYSPSICRRAFEDCVRSDCVGCRYIRGLNSGLLHLGGLLIDHVVQKFDFSRMPKGIEIWERKKEKHARSALFATDLKNFLCTLPEFTPYTCLANQRSWIMADSDEDTIRWLDIFNQIISPLLADERDIDITWRTFAIWKAMAAHISLPRVTAPDKKDRYGTKQLFERYFDIATKHMMLFVTSSGFLGLGLDRVQEGDSIVLVHGCESPIVLRQTVDDRYTFQGLAFVNGIMEGELLDMITDDHIEHETFVLT